MRWIQAKVFVCMLGQPPLLNVKPFLFGLDTERGDLRD
jgi:hypothetical protein